MTTPPTTPGTGSPLDDPADDPTEAAPDEPISYRLTHDDRVVEAGSLTELVADLIPGYGELPGTADGDELALLARWQQAVTTANRVQAVLIADVAERGTFDVGTAGEEVLSVLFADRIDPVEVEEWAQPVPLVVVSTSYAPFTDATPPTGNVRWINPHTELTYLQTLAGLGVVALDGPRAALT
ncbi:hypothetical protein [Microlunatus ginsengisoli]|uniref:SseB protein N-terminal domain-containing protein n=1 Tax=Microlunatus ginsengisoli TaxID=363863 RepID=A0ABP7ALJ1_9ACTN